MRTRYSFGPFLLDPDERRLLREGQPIALPRKAFDVLALLVARAGHLVTKKSLMETAWADSVVEENTLSVAVSRLRSVLGEVGHRYIEAVPGYGYRFVAPVAVLGADAGASAGTDGLDGTDGEAPDVERAVPTLSLHLPPASRGDGITPSLPHRILTPNPFRSPLHLWTLGGAVVAVLVLGLALRGTQRADRVLTHVVPARAVSPPSADAQAAYRRGEAAWRTRHGEEMAGALASFKLAARLDSTFALAYLGQAQYYAIGYQTGPEAEEALRRALALDSTLAAAWATHGFVRAFQAWDWTGAEAAFERALDLDPDDVTTLQWLASLRMVQRRLAEAEALLRRAVVLDPEYVPLYADLCEVLYYQRSYDDALAVCNHALALDPKNSIALNHRFFVTLAPRRDAEIDPLLRPPPDSLLARRSTRVVLEQKLRAQIAQSLRAPFDDFFLARSYAALGERDSALTHVEAAVTEQVLVAPFLHPDPLFDPFRHDPRWQAAIQRMGLSPLKQSAHESVRQRNMMRAGA